MSRSRRVRLRPTATSGGLALVVLTCWYAGASQGNGAALALAALLAAAAAVSSALTWRNVSGVRILQQLPARGFAGEPVKIPLHALTHAGTARGLRLAAPWPGFQFRGDAVDAGESGVEVCVEWRPSSRGWQSLQGLRMESRFPFGWLRAIVASADPVHCLIYPRPAGRHAFPPQRGHAESTRAASRTDDGDFDGHMAYRDGDSQRRVDWKASARREQLMLKRYRTGETRRLVLDWEATARDGVEAQLSQLCLWVCEAEKQGIEYAVYLPGSRGSFGQGARHRCETLRRLAEFQLPPAPGGSPLPELAERRPVL